jgi:PIN domain-containing protein
VDRSLGRYTVANHLRAAGLKVCAHDDHFKQNTPDDVWLRDVGRRRWIVITKDKNIRKRYLERDALVAARVRAFVFTGGQISGVEMGEILVAAIGKIGKLLDSTPPPFVARITGAGDVAIIPVDEEQ